MNQNTYHTSEEQNELTTDQAHASRRGGNQPIVSGPSNAFVAVSWTMLLVGMTAYFIGLYNATMALNEKGYYFTIIMFGLFSVVSVQKSVRDRLEGVPVTDIYYGISWFAAILSITLLTIGLWNAQLSLSEKGFYSMSFLLSMFSAIAVQKNTRDRQAVETR